MNSYTKMSEGYGAASLDVPAMWFNRGHIEIQVHPTHVNVYLNSENGRATYHARKTTFQGSEAVTQFAAICNGESLPMIAADWVDEYPETASGDFKPADVAKYLRQCVQS
jgi:hypothetical protein